LAFAATMIRPRYIRDLIVARKGSASAFLHTLGQKQTNEGSARKFRSWG